MLNKEEINSLAVLDINEVPVGILTSQNVIDQIANDIPMETLLSSLKLDPPVFAGLHQPVSQIAKTMKIKHEYKVIIINQNGTVEGVVTARDILKEIT